MKTAHDLVMDYALAIKTGRETDTFILPCERIQSGKNECQDQWPLPASAFNLGLPPRYPSEWCSTCLEKMHAIDRGVEAHKQKEWTLWKMREYAAKVWGNPIQT